MKYIMDDEVYCIDREIQPLGVHEIYYKDARYFVDTPKGGQDFSTKDDTLIKVTKTMTLT